MLHQISCQFNLLVLNLYVSSEYPLFHCDQSSRNSSENCVLKKSRKGAFSINSGNEKKRENEKLYASNISAMMIDTKVIVVLIKYTLNISEHQCLNNSQMIFTLFISYKIHSTITQSGMSRILVRSWSANVAHLSFNHRTQTFQDQNQSRATRVQTAEQNCTAIHIFHAIE